MTTETRRDSLIGAARSLTDELARPDMEGCSVSELIGQIVELWNEGETQIGPLQSLIADYAMDGEPQTGIECVLADLLEICEGVGVDFWTACEAAKLIREDRGHDGMSPIELPMIEA
jgi:hypothetical protein